MPPCGCADARTYYSRLTVNHGVEFEEAKKYRDDYIQGKKDAGQHVSSRNGFYINKNIQNQGKTGLSLCFYPLYSIRICSRCINLIAVACVAEMVPDISAFDNSHYFRAGLTTIVNPSD